MIEIDAAVRLVGTVCTYGAFLGALAVLVLMHNGRRRALQPVRWVFRLICMAAIFLVLFDWIAFPQVYGRVVNRGLLCSEVWLMLWWILQATHVNSVRL